MSAQTAPEISPIHYFGNEAERFATLSTLDYDQFRQHLIQTHNNHPGMGREYGFTKGVNHTGGGSFYPMPEDKDEVLSYALEQAKAADSIQTAALILGTAIVFTHPFADGNGRTSRTEYSYWSRGLDDKSSTHRLLRTSVSGSDAKELINFGDIIHEEADELLEDIMCKDAGFSRMADLAWSYSNDPEAVKTPYGEREYAGLEDQEANELDELLGRGDGFDERYGKIAANSAVWLFALSKIQAEHGIELPLEQVTMEGHDYTRVNLPDSLAIMDPATKRQFIGYLKEGYKRKAKAAIDLMGKHGNESAGLVGYPEMSIRDFLVERTNNYLASKIGSKAMRASL